jgi:hypothetical protein
VPLHCFVVIAVIFTQGYGDGMSKPATPPLSPTVAAVFSDFLKKLESEKIAESEAIEGLRNVLKEQNLDPDSFRSALFDVELKQL